MRFDTSMVVGALEVGTTTVGAFPKVPAGEGSGIAAKDLGIVVVVAALVVVVVGAAAAVVVVVVVGFLPPEKRKAPVPTTSTARMATMMPRGMFLRRDRK